MHENSVKLYISSNMKKLIRPIMLLSFLSLLMSLLPLLLAYFTKDTLDAVLNNGESLFFKNAFIVSSIIIILLATLFVEQHLNTYYIAQKNIELNNSLFTKILNGTLKETSKNSPNLLLTYIDNDVENISVGLVSIIPKYIFFFTRFFFAFALLLILDLIIALVLIGSGSILLILIKLISFGEKRKQNILDHAELSLQNLLKDSLENIDVIKSFEGENIIIDKFSNAQKIHFKALHKKQLIKIREQSVSYFFFAFAYVFVLIFGSLKIQENVITLGTLIAIVMLIHSIYSAYSRLPQFSSLKLSMTSSTYKILTIEQLENEEFHSINEHIEFEALVLEDISFKYGQQYIMKKVSHRINKNSFVHVHGEIMKGKTNLFKLLLGLHKPLEGFIFFTNGKDRFLCDATTRHLFSYVNQKNIFISGTIKENLELYQKTTEVNLVQACQIVGIYDVIKALPKGFDTMMDETGLDLAEEQLQRLAIARALIKNAPILLLDEITSAFDPVIEKRILTSIKTLTHKTCFIISHRTLPKDLIDQSIDL